MRLKILILTNLLFLILTGCASEQPVDPNVAQDMIATAWHSDQHTIWEIDWPAVPIGDPVTVETWHAGQRYRFEILESSAPALVGQTLVFDGQTGWCYNRFEASPPEAASLRVLSPVSDAFEVINRLTATPPITATRQKSAALNHGPAQKIGLTFENGDNLTVWIDKETGLPVRLIFRVEGNQANLKARYVEPLANPPEGLFRPDVHVRR